MRTLYRCALVLIPALTMKGESPAPTSRKLKRLSGPILAVLVAVLAAAGPPRAMAQTTGTPNGGFIAFNLASGTSTAPITLPADIPWLGLSKNTVLDIVKRDCAA
jgi:hypothetical protein